MNPRRAFESGRPAQPPASGEGGRILRFERCKLVFWASLAKHMRLASTDPSGCGATVAHVLWEPQGGLRRTLARPKHGGPSGDDSDPLLTLEEPGARRQCR
jgi:hypothetical protein